MSKYEKKDFEKIPPIEEAEDGTLIFNLACDGANADWIRARRKIKDGEKEKLKEMESEDMYRLKDDA